MYVLRTLSVKWKCTKQQVSSTKYKKQKNIIENKQPHVPIIFDSFAFNSQFQFHLQIFKIIKKKMIFFDITQHYSIFTLSLKLSSSES